MLRDHGCRCGSVLLVHRHSQFHGRQLPAINVIRRRYRLAHLICCIAQGQFRGRLLLKSNPGLLLLLLLLVLLLLCGRWQLVNDDTLNLVLLLAITSLRVGVRSVGTFRGTDPGVQAARCSTVRVLKAQRGRESVTQLIQSSLNNHLFNRIKILT